MQFSQILPIKVAWLALDCGSGWLCNRSLWSLGTWQDGWVCRQVENLWAESAVQSVIMVTQNRLAFL
ncbi:hypothetical protein QUF64_12000 [Anaerolineales bacterium HSG6]|nr:hypothetical protein [Anaerolineales bacterium HSG6]MDM8532799.1 hypothetical protein [Anaerolineales bacterium HSG25]